MPRITRAALRSKAALESAELAASVPLPLTPSKERAPLGEIAGNAVGDTCMDHATNEVFKVQKKGSTRSKNGRNTKKAAPVNKSTGNGPVEVLEDDNLSATSSAVEEACEDLLKNHDSGTFHHHARDLRSC